ncbi:uncharacterized protein LOC133706647 isoform X2 [Rosa rugosa]|nr:uncharacterized protein LOC133706647 isoform X2 [Rosa rugosa]XP_061988170.1 uncharacterized protein LOC133706647 isoform X2 [Rosa rugosa]
MHCALPRANIDFQKGADRGRDSLSRKEQSSFRISSEECEVPSVTWRNSDHRCAIFKFLSLEPDGQWRIVALPLQCNDNINNLVLDAVVNMESLRLVYSPPISHFKFNRQKMQKGPPMDVAYSVKSFTNRRFTGSTMRHQYRNKTLVNKATKWNVSKKFQKSLTSNDPSAMILNDSNAIKSSDVVSNRKIDGNVKRSSRKKSRKKGKQSKKVSCNVGSTDHEVIYEEYGNVSSASETCGNKDGDGPAPSSTAPEISLPDSKNSSDEVGTVSNFENHIVLEDSAFPILDGVEAIQHTKASCYNDLYTKGYSEMHDSYVLDSISIGSNSDGSTNLGHDEKHAEKEMYNTDISDPADSSSRKGYFTRQRSLNDVVNTYNHTEDAGQGTHDFGSSSDMKFVVPNKRSRQNKVGQRSANVPKSGSVGNMRTGVWQKVLKNDANDCTGELKKASSVYSRLDLPLREAPMLNKTCNAVDVNVFLKSENRKQQKDKVSKKLKRKNAPALKREYNCYSRKGSHASLAGSDGSLKLRMDQSDISDILSQAKDKKPSRPTAGFQSSKVECMNSVSVQSMQLCPNEIGHLENVCKTVSGMKNQNVGNQDGSMQKTCNSWKEPSLHQVQSSVYLPHLLYDAASQEVQRQIPLAESSKQNRSSSGSLTHKWMPIGLKDSELASFVRSESSLLEHSDEGASKRWTIKDTVKGNVVSKTAVESMAQGSGHVTRSSDDTEGRLPTSNAVEEVANNKLHAANYVNSYDVSKGLNAFEAYSNRVLEAVNNACRAQLASEAVQRTTGHPIAEFERLLYYSSPVIHQSPSHTSCHTCCSWNQVDQVGGVSLCRHETLNITLGCLWEWYEKYGSYGLEIRAEEPGSPKRLGADRLAFRAYFVPYLSGIQLFRNGRSTGTRDIDNRLHNHQVLSACWSGEISRKSSSIGSLPIYSLLFSHLDCKEDAVIPPLVNELGIREAFAKDVTVQSADTTGFSDLELLLEYFEYEQPQQRRPLYDKIKELVRGDGHSHSKVYGDPTTLDSINLNDLHPRSWYSVAWYPIYRIPDGNFRAAFLTYHSLGCLVRRNANFESRSVDDCIVSPVVGLQSYNAQSECWFQLRPSAPAQTTLSNLNPCEILEERLRTLEETASLMSRAVVSKGSMTSVNRHPDYEFFLSRRR